MLMRCEVHKLLGGKTKWFLLLLILVNILLYYLYLLPAVPASEEQVLYEQLSRKMTQYNMEDALERIEARSEEVNGYLYGTVDENGVYVDTHLDDSSALLESSVLGRMQTEYQEALGFYEFVESIDVRAEHLLTFSIFSEEGSFSKRNIEKTGKDFSDLKEIRVSPQNGTGLTMMQEFSLSDFLAVAAVCILAFQIFGRDGRSGMQGLLNATLNGGKKLRCIQTLVIFLSVAVFAVLLYGSNLVQTGCLLGFPDLSEEIHGIAEYRNIPFPCTAGVFLALYLLWKIMALTAVAAVFQAVIYRTNGRKISWIILGTGIGLSFVLWMYLPENPTAEIFRYLNVTGIFDTGAILAEYQNLNFFGCPVQLLTAAVWLCVIAFAAGAASVIFLRSAELPDILWEKKKLPERQRGILFYEFYKTAWIQKGGAVLLILCMISVWQIIQNGSGEELLSKEEYFYEQYAKDLNGKSGSDLRTALNTLLETSDNENPEAEEKVRIQAEALLREEGRNLTFLNERIWNSLFKDRQTELTNMFLYVAAMMFTLAGMFQFESAGKMKLLLRPVKNGGRVYWSKFLVACSAGTVYTMVIWTPFYLIWFHRYGETVGMDCPAASLEIFRGMTSGIPVRGMLIVTIMMRFLAGMAVAAVLFLAAQIFLSVYQFIGAVTCLLLLPDALLIIGGMEMQYESPVLKVVRYSIAPHLQYIGIFTSWASYWQQISAAAYAAAAIILVLAVTAGYRKWRYGRILGLRRNKAYQ